MLQYYIICNAQMCFIRTLEKSCLIEKRIYRLNSRFLNQRKRSHYVIRFFQNTNSNNILTKLLDLWFME